MGLRKACVSYTEVLLFTNPAKKTTLADRLSWAPTTGWYCSDFWDPVMNPRRSLHPGEAFADEHITAGVTKLNDAKAEGAVRESVMWVLWWPQTLHSPPPRESTRTKKPTASSEIYHDIRVGAMLSHGLLLANSCTGQDFQNRPSPGRQGIPLMADFGEKTSLAMPKLP